MVVAVALAVAISILLIELINYIYENVFNIITKSFKLKKKQYQFE